MAKIKKVVLTFDEADLTDVVEFHVYYDQNQITELSPFVVIPVVAGQTNVVLVDGVNGASGVLQLNYSLLSSISLRPLGTALDGANLVQVLSRTNANFTLQRSSNMIHWASILTTNSPSGAFNYADPKPPGSVRYFYRAQLLP